MTAVVVVFIFILAASQKKRVTVIAASKSILNKVPLVTKKNYLLAPAGLVLIVVFFLTLRSHAFLIFPGTRQILLVSIQQ